MIEINRPGWDPLHPVDKLLLVTGDIRFLFNDGWTCDIHDCEVRVATRYTEEERTGPGPMPPETRLARAHRRQMLDHRSQARG